MDRKGKNKILIKDLCWSYGEKKVFHNISLSFKRNRFYSIIGPNGSGKSTLLKNILKVLEPQKGTIYIDDTDLVTLRSREIAKRMSSVPQNTHIDFDFTVQDIVLMGRNPYIRRFQSESARDIQISKKAMLDTNTWELRDKNINEISGGERQRVIVARALAQEADIMLLDEPVSQLDIHHQLEVMDTLRILVDNSGLTVISVLHDLNLAAQYSDHIILLNGGGVVAEGSPDQVLTKANIETAYNIEVQIISNPVTGKPHIIPIKSRNSETMAV